MKTICPNPACRIEMACDDSLAGKEIQCPACRQVFIAAAPAAASLPLETPAQSAPAPAAPASPKVSRKNSQLALVFGVLSIGAGFMAALVEFFGGLCCVFCSPIGWPFSLVGVICGILAIVLGDQLLHRLLGIVGIILSVIVVILHLLILYGLAAWLKASWPQSVR